VDRSAFQSSLDWQSKLILLLVFPAVGVDLVMSFSAWGVTLLPAAGIWTFALSALLGLVAWKQGAATPWAAVSGAAIAACITISTLPGNDYQSYRPWRTAMLPLVALMVLTSLATRLGRARKEQLGTAEQRRGRAPSQVAANLGVATLVWMPVVLIWLDRLGVLQLSFMRVHGFSGMFWSSTLPFTVGLAALAESAADTVSSEIGQVLGGRPRMLTTLRAVEPGTDGAISVIGTLAGTVAGGLVAAAGVLAMAGGWEMFGIASIAAVFGLLFDSLLGATVERRGWLNNDAVNFLSTASAAGFGMVLLTLVRRMELG
jgi:uncharacterized protein (TIGR00297 family)